MKKKAVLVILSGMVMGASLIGCSWLDDEEITDGGDTEVVSEGISRVDELYSKLMSGEATADELRELANLYKEQGFIAKQRDVLEQCYMKYGEAADLEALDNIWVNAIEDNAQVRDEINYLIANLDNVDMRGEAVAVVTSEAFMDILKPGIYTGYRNYFLAMDDKTTTICVGYDENGMAVVRVWIEYSDGRMVCINNESFMVKIYDDHATEGQYDGEFTQWIMNEKTGDLTVETCSIKNGNLDGEYSASIHKGEGQMKASEIYALKDQYTYDTYKGTFDGTGATTTEKPNELTTKALIEGTEYSGVSVYAYNEKKTAFLYKGLTDANNNVYSADNWGISIKPTYEKYDIAIEEENTSKIDVKVVNGRLYVYDGNSWNDCGNVQDVASEDPFVTAKENRVETEIDVSSIEQAKEDTRTVGGVVEEKKAETDKKPSTKPTQAPVATPEPAPVSDGGGSSSGGSSNPAPSNPEPAPTPAPEPAADPAPSGGDTDVEWTDDLL